MQENIPSIQQTPEPEITPEYKNRGTTMDAIIVRGDKILLIKRGMEPHKGKWATPGGYLDWNETIFEATIREILEETGLHAKKEDITFVAFNTDPARHPRQAINFVFIVRIPNGEPVAGDDAQDLAWFSLDNLPEEMAFDHLQNIQLALPLINQSQS